MFHKYVLATSGLFVDIDRASFLMDKGLFEEALMEARLDPEGAFTQNGDMCDFAQDTWDHYCRLHLNKYGKPFGPNTDPTWDIGDIKVPEPQYEPLPPLEAGANPPIRLLPKGHPKRLGW